RVNGLSSFPFSVSSGTSLTAVMACASSDPCRVSM
ncbi:hypothetical protein AZZ62_004876, partial [Klebsiella variicola]